MSEINKNIRVIELASYEAPKITEDKKNDWVTFGENNSYFQFLIDRYKIVATKLKLNSSIKVIIGFTNNIPANKIIRRKKSAISATDTVSVPVIWLTPEVRE